jgi:hypothetical protein
VNAPLSTDLVAAFPSGDFLNSEPTRGLTKRELFAAMMAQAILTGAVTRGCPAHEWTDQSMAMKCADALLAALKETP